MENEENSDEIRNDINNRVFWKNLSIKYWYFILIFGLIIVGAIAGFLVTLNWYTFTSARYGNNGTWTFNDFSMRSALIWIVMLFVWEILIVLLPTLLVGAFVCAIIWFIVLPQDLKDELKMRGKKAEMKEEEWKKKHHKKHGHRSTQSGGAFTFLVFVGLCIYIAVEGNWNMAFGTLSIGYFITRWITVFYLGLIILGVPALTFGLLWYWKKFGKE
jgi:hypothetical protein